MRPNLLLAAIGFLAMSFVFSLLLTNESLANNTTARVVEVWIVLACFWIGILCVAALLLAVVLERSGRS